MKINWKKILMFSLGACGLIVSLVLSYVNLTVVTLLRIGISCNL